MASTTRVAFLLALVALTPLLAGCNFKDWYNQEGKVNVALVAVGPTNTSLSEFSTIKIAIYGVSVKQYLVIATKEFKFDAAPLVIDLVEKGTKGERTMLVQNVQENIRAIESVTLRLDVIEAIDAQGKPMPICHENDETTAFPCFFVPANGAFRHQDRNIPVPRGGVLTIGFPLAVSSFGNPGRIEYSLFEDPALVEISTS
ncbi:MAG: hypothetical protein WDA16_06915 [Candidatus Thermoplasmatota archaeon]